MNITIVGHVCIDKNITEHASYIAAGSPAMFMHTICRQFPDTKVTVIAPYGEDFLHYANGVQLYLDHPTGKKTPAYENIMKDGMRVQKAHYRDYAVPVQIDNSIESLMAFSDIVVIAPLLPNYPPAYIRNLFSFIRPDALTVLLPQGYFRDVDDNDVVQKRVFWEADSVLPLFDVIIVSEQDSSNMISKATRWVEKFKRLVVVTRAENGAIAFTPEKEIALSARPVPEKEIIDSTGSGDIFSIGFAYRYKQTRDIKESGRFANELARQCLFFTPENMKIDLRLLKNGMDNKYSE